MNQRRIVAAVAFSVVILAVLGAIILIYAVNNSSSVTVYVLKHNVAAGATLVREDIDPLTVRATGHEFDFAERNSVDDLLNAHVGYRTSLAQGDVLRHDDLVSSGGFAEVPVNITVSPTLAKDDIIDLYIHIDETGQDERIGRGVTVVSPGSPAVISVPANQAADWVAVASSSRRITAVRTTGRIDGNVTKRINDALADLGGAQGGAQVPVTSPGATPAASPTP